MSIVKTPGKSGHSTKQLGIYGEKLARELLVSKGFNILSCNWRSRHGEVDLIAMDGEILCFIEVRARSSSKRGHPLETVNYRKQRQIARLADEYIQMNELEDKPVRFDVVGILMRGDEAEITHIVGAFEAPADYR